MTYLNPNFVWGPNLAFFAFGPWAIIHGIGPKLANSLIFQIWTLMNPFERSLSKLSENQKIVEIWSTELKLRQWLNFENVLTSYESSLFPDSALTAALECWNSLQPSPRKLNHQLLLLAVVRVEGISCLPSHWSMLTLPAPSQEEELRGASDDGLTTLKVMYLVQGCA